MSDNKRHADLFPQYREQADELLRNIISKHDELTALLEEVSGKWGYDDPMYRFYSQSFKVYTLQHSTQTIVSALRSIAPKETMFNPFFEEIILAGASGREFNMAHNTEWTLHTRPLIEAFFHARYFLDVAVKMGKDQDTTREFKTWDGWALLSLYNMWTIG